MTKQQLENILMRLGVTEKSARLYLANIDIGASTIQKLASAAGIKRATAYNAIQELIAVGLVSEYKEGKKTQFVAETPEKIFSTINKERIKLDNQQKILDESLPELMARFRGHEGKPQIKFFEGHAGLEAIHDDILKSSPREIQNVVSLDDAIKIEHMMNKIAVHKFREHLEKRKTKIKILYTGNKVDFQTGNKKPKSWETRYLNQKSHALHGELTIYGDKVAAFSYRGKIIGTLIENREIAQVIRTLFELAWNKKCTCEGASID